jgi:6-phosphogluconolactonase/glucosamine-6-phosphate isomerase/deaminase
MGIKKENVLKFDLFESGVLSLDELSVITHQNVDLALLSQEDSALPQEKLVFKRVLEKVSKFCSDYEARIRSLGGIVLFFGGFGPVGHMALISRGAAHDSPTRIVNFNYPTAAAAATDLGGIEIARGKGAMTIGLGTISYNQNATVIIMAAGEGKAEVVRAGIEDPADPERPSSILHSLPGGRFYITHGAASKLTARKANRIQSVTTDSLEWATNHLSGLDPVYGITEAHLVDAPLDYQRIESFIYSASLAKKIAVHKLVLADLIDLAEYQTIPSWFKDPLTFKVMASCASRRLREKIEGGLQASAPTAMSVLHTAPHHDDIMLSYHAAMHHMLGRRSVESLRAGSLRANVTANAGPLSPLTAVSTEAGVQLTTPGHQAQSTFPIVSGLKLGETYNHNVNHFAYLTSGFHSVNDAFLRRQILAVSGPGDSYQFLTNAVLDGELTRDYDELMAHFRHAFFRKDFVAQDKIEHFIFLRKVAEVFHVTVTQSYNSLIAALKVHIKWLKEEYLPGHQPGDAIPKDIQILKGCMRESEVDRVWALSSMPMNRVHHMRSKFYTDDFFTPMPSLEDDAMPMANLIKARQPDVITVAFDPEGTGPDTHYKVLQVVAAGLRIAIARGDLINPNPLVWGYRNVWFVFQPSEATLMIPGTAEDLDLMHDTFMSCFTTQKLASFPSPFYDGPFSAWARHLQWEHKETLECLLGKEYFETHDDKRVRESAGFVFLRAMHARVFLKEVEELKSKFEMQATTI